MTLKLLWRTVTSLLLAILIVGCQLLKDVKEKPIKPGTLTVTFTTTSPGGKRNRDPKNIHAVWIEDGKGLFVKTLGRWAAKRKKELPLWHATDGEDIDGVTGATQNSYGAYQVVWDMLDRNGTVVPNGEYRIRMELTNNDAKHGNFHRTTFTFTKDGTAHEQTIAEQDGYQTVSIRYTGRQE